VQFNFEIEREADGRWIAEIPGSSRSIGLRTVGGSSRGESIRIGTICHCGRCGTVERHSRIHQHPHRVRV